ncbi:Isopropylmalate/homocitrate/citramalate synthases [Butyrivibrio fibrisolvens 16/4]|jgi:4-hydroxy 2-oxovalerate aldolase|nr:Isopropylmalate/homocitrate/citramalate synthases [Butyrivibrio fibrisolvens 16/4]
MEQHIRLLDCTLRDGGHIVAGKFGETVIKNTIERLVEAGVDIIEVGFLWDSVYGTDTARYYTIEDVKRILPKDKGRSQFSLMADFIDLEHLEPCDGTIDIIRLSFKRWRLDWGLKTARILMDKGYKVFINPVNNNVYSDKEYIEVLEKVNELHPYGFSIVDTFGVMRVKDLSHRYYLVENNLLPDITIGVHLHENLGLAYNLAQHMTQIANPTRKIVIDGSLLGMGRVPGNLCIEQIADYMNEQFDTGYALEPIYDAIDDYIAPIKAKEPWGYAIPYALSAKYYLHRTYAEHLMGKQRLKTKDIQRILSQVDESEAETFNEEYIEKLYHEYMNVKYDDSADVKRLEDYIKKYDDILVLCPGESLKAAKDDIMSADSDSTCVIAVNFVPETGADIIFLTNMKRYDSIKHKADDSSLVITSNLMRDITDASAVIEYNELVYFNDEYCDDSTLMLVNLLSRIGVKKIHFAGFDGSKDGKLKFVDDSLSSHEENPNRSESVKKILDNNFGNIEKIFLTDSVYK